MNGAGRMCRRRRYMWSRRGVIREVSRDFSCDATSFPGESTGGKLEVKKDPVAFRDHIGQT